MPRNPAIKFGNLFQQIDDPRFRMAVGKIASRVVV
jgi:hypothetical protein